jgi:hypothetical protein
MKLEICAKEECLRQALEITKAYAQSGENKHGPMTEFLELVYQKLLELRADVGKNA